MIYRLLMSSNTIYFVCDYVVGHSYHRSPIDGDKHSLMEGVAID